MTIDGTFRTGDRVLVGAHGQADVAARVILASPDGRSLMLEFPGGLFGVAGGAYLGTMPVLQQADGRWIELINQREVSVRKVPASFICPRCGAVSYNPNDLRERYCGRCHVFVDD